MPQQSVEGFPLSPQQTRLWRSQTDSTAFRARCALLLEGDVDTRQLQVAAHRLVRRHSILRTTFRALPGMRTPLQVVSDSAARADWRFVECDGAERRPLAVEVAELFRRDEAAPFELERGPLLRVTLKKLSPGEHLMLISLPSLCADARTLVVLASELGRLYKKSHLGGGADDDEEEPLEYVQFAEWQNELLADEDAERGLAYWRRLSPPASHASRLACEAAPRDASSFDPQTCDLSLGAADAARLRVVAAEHGGSTAALLLAVWQTLLWRLTGRGEIVVESVCDGRGHEFLRAACGLFTRALPVRASIEPSLPFGELMRRTSASVREAVAWQDYFTAESVGAGAEASAPGLSFLFLFEEWPGSFDFGDLSCVLQRQDTCAEPFKINCTAVSRGDELHVELRYDAGRFCQGDVEYLAGLYVTLLRNAAAQPELSVGELDALSEADRHRVLFEFSETAAEVARAGCVHQQFEAQAERSADVVAVVFEDKQLTYRQLNRMANSLARHLRALGVGPEVVVGLFIERSAEMLVGLLGILKAGGAYLPLDPTQPTERLAYMLRDAAAPVVVTTSRLLPFLPGRRARAVLLDADWGEIAKRSGEDLASLAAPENLAYVIYTSGSTGQPKGAMVQHRSVVNLVAALDDAIYRHERAALKVSLNAPLTFDASVKQWPRLLRGHTLVILPEDVRLDARALLRHVERQGIDVLDCTPTQLKALLAARQQEESGQWPLVVLVGGEALDEATWALLARSGAASFYNLYGLTECTVDSTAARVCAGSTRATVGRPLGNTRLYLLDRQLKPLPVGAAGEIYIGGEGLARGYVGAPAPTAERFIPDPFSTQPGARLYRTGDAARHLPDGRIEFLGRLDYQLKIRGFRVEPGEIEAALAQHPAVQEAVVTAAHEAGEREEIRLIAYVVFRRGGQRSGEDINLALQEFLRRRLPEFMIPTDIVAREHLPRTRNGKVDRRALPEWVPPQARARTPYAAPRDEVERMVASVWRQVLNVEQVGIHDNFFDLGGHSLLLTYAYNQLRASLDREFSIVDMFRYPTVSSLAQHLSAGTQTALSHEQIRARVEQQKESARRRQAIRREQR
jgi:amino acid adenylation domain-containing protein